MRRASLAALLALGACGNSQGAQAPNPEAAGCIAHRTAKQLECDDLYKTRAEIDACRDKVKAEIDCTKDGGADVSLD